MAAHFVRFQFASAQIGPRTVDICQRRGVASLLQVIPPGVCHCAHRPESGLTLEMHAGQNSPRVPKAAPEEKDVVQLFNSDSKRVSLFQCFQQTNLVNVMQA